MPPGRSVWRWCCDSAFGKWMNRKKPELQKRCRDSEIKRHKELQRARARSLAHTQRLGLLFVGLQCSCSPAGLSYKSSGLLNYICLFPEDTWGHICIIFLILYKSSKSGAFYSREPTHTRNDYNFHYFSSCRIWLWFPSQRFPYICSISLGKSCPIFFYFLAIWKYTSTSLQKN